MTMFGSQWFASPSSTYEIDNSCVFNGTDASMSRTPGSAGNQKILTQSIWVKRGKITTDQTLGVNVSGGASTGLGVWFNADDTMSVYVLNDSGWVGKLTTTKTFRDPGAWYHVVFSVDTPQAVAANRIKLYINGSQINNLSIGAYPDQDTTTQFNNTVAHYIGRYASSASYWADMYQAEHHWIDGTALTPSSFGETNDEGVWVPKKYSGSYGTTGFYLDYADGADLGDDNSGQGNDWAESNLAASDQSTDTPSNNFCTVNPIYRGSNTTASAYGATTFGNLGLQFSGSADGGTLCTQIFPTGKFYWEIRVVAGGDSSSYDLGGGIADASGSYTKGTERMRGIATGEIGFNSYNGEVRFSDSVTKTYSEAPFDDGDIIGVAADATNGAIYYSKNGTFMGSGDPTSAGSKTNAGATWTAASYTGWVPTGNVSGGSTPVQMFNFGQNGTFDGTVTAGGNSDGNGVGNFLYSVPSGYLALCSNNLEAPAITDGSTNFQMDDFAGTGSSNARTFGGNSDMQPDILWIKAKNTTTGWIEFNAAVGVEKYNTLNNQDGEASDSNSLTAFNTDGFTVGSLAAVNSGSYGFFGFGWSAGNSGSSNEDGGINTTTTFVDTSAGISVGTYTGTGSGATVGHGLGVTPATVIIFPRSNGDHKLVANWQSGISAYGEKWKLNDTEAASSSSNQITAASSTTFTLGTDTGVNGSSRTYSYYAFAEVPGFSKFGTYTGNGNADGAFLYCGFKPAIIIAKCDRAGEDWIQFNTKTDAYNPLINYAYPNDTAAFTNSANFLVDFLSNGIKMRGTESRINRSGNAIVFMAFAENPFGGDGVAPTTAR